MKETEMRMENMKLEIEAMQLKYTQLQQGKEVEEEAKQTAPERDADHDCREIALLRRENQLLRLQMSGRTGDTDRPQVLLRDVEETLLSFDGEDQS